MFASGTSYSYDTLDNLVRVKAPGRDHTYLYDTKWQLTNVTNTASGVSVIGLGYDPQGNLSNKNGVPYDFDLGNRLRSVTPATGKQIYRYDGHGRRVSIASSRGNLIYQYSASGQLMHQRDRRTGTDTRTDYISLGGSLVAEREQDVPTLAVTTRYQHTDALGSPVVVTNAARAVIEQSDFEPYGLLLNHALTDGPGYTGHVSDAETGLSYMQQRYYDSGIGRFLSVDPVTADGNSGNFNRYWYANNNPYKFTDPDGREVVVNIERDTYTNVSVTSRLTVTSDKTNQSFSGFGLEDSRGGRNRDKEPLKADTYAATVRTDGEKGWRLELESKNNYKNAQIHVGNSADNVEGCVAVGTSRSANYVSGSKKALNAIQSIVNADGTGKIKVNLQNGSPTKGASFQGVFRVNGKLDSIRLDKKLSGK
jgi:RHS repeat-associated protein